MVALVNGQDVEQAARVFGRSDDLIVIQGGHCAGEIDCYGKAGGSRSILLGFSDGTLLQVRHGKRGTSIWEITVIQKGGQFDRLESCDDPDAQLCSDVVYFRGRIRGCSVMFWDTSVVGIEIPADAMEVL